MQRVISTHATASHVLFCGDGVKDIAKMASLFPQKIFLDVRGNCDSLYSALDVPEERFLTLFGHNILLLHGHTVGVKGGIGFAAAYAAQKEADILIFGHTHLPYEGRVTFGDKDVHLFNPGSIGSSRNGSCSYGILTVKENGYLFSHGSI